MKTTSSDDLYGEWLGVALTAGRPPDHYALLGLARFCANFTAIEDAVSHQLDRLDRRALHPDPDRRRACQQLMNEVARARVVLTSPETKAEYDARLVAGIGAVAARAAVAPPGATLPAPATAWPRAQASPIAPATSAPEEPPNDEGWNWIEVDDGRSEHDEAEEAAAVPLSQAASLQVEDQSDTLAGAAASARSRQRPGAGGLRRGKAQRTAKRSDRRSAWVLGVAAALVGTAVGVSLAFLVWRPRATQSPGDATKTEAIARASSGQSTALIARPPARRVDGVPSAVDSWDEDHRAVIIALMNKAQALAAAGKLVEAREEYGEMDKLIGGRDIRDPELKRLVDSARADQDRIYHTLLAGVLDKKASRPTTVAAIAPKITPVPPIEPRKITPAAPSLSSGQAPSPAPPVLDRPAPQPVPEDRQALTDERVGQSIQSGVNYLFTRFDNRHVLRGAENNDPAWQCGEDALAVYALLQCGEAINDPRLKTRGPEMKALIDAMKQLPIHGSYETYARGIRATALALFDRPEDFAALKADADWLIGTCDEGAYTYTNRTIHNPPTFGDGWGNGAPRGAWDNSNSQYGVLGVSSAAEAEPKIEVPSAYWRAVERHWTTCQEGDGEWGYHRGGGRLAMTCAGIASLFVTHEYLDPATGPAEPVGRDPFSPALKKGLDWFEQGDHVASDEGGHWGYRLYGIERAGLAGGFKYFGRHDWYREFAAEILSRQNANGSWGDGPIDTSYALLFLARGLHPILMNKLRFDGFWANRPQDAGNLARYTGRQLDRPLNWQVVNIKSDWTDWANSPVLYLASHEAPKLTDVDIDRIRDFVLGGGLLFTHADAGSESFNLFAANLAHRLFPAYEMADLPANHLIYTINFKPEARPPLKYVSNGARVVMVHSPTDLSTHWQKREDRTWEGGRDDKADPAYKSRQLAPFQMGANLFIYAAGKRDLRNRLQVTWVPPTNAAPLATIKVARLQYSGNWDPEPAAWQRYTNWFQRRTGYRLDVQTEMLKDLKPSDATVATLTGTARTAFTAEEVVAVRAYVQAGGVLLVDMAGGTGQFDQSASNSLLSPAFPSGFPKPLSPSHPVLNADAPGMEDVTHPRLRSYAIERFGHSAIFPDYLAAGKGHVIATNLDLTCGLLNADTSGIIGYDPTYAEALVKNILFWTMDGQPDK